MSTTSIITSDTIEQESYYNVSKMAHFTKYANPVSAIKETGERIRILKDDNGNVIHAWLLNPSELEGWKVLV